jgi:hypothetical protein
MVRRGGGWRSTATSCNTADAPVNSISSSPVPIPEFSPLDRRFPIYSHVIGFRKSLPHPLIPLFFSFLDASFYAWSGLQWCVPVSFRSDILPEGSNQAFGNLPYFLTRSLYALNSTTAERILYQRLLREILRLFRFPFTSDNLNDDFNLLKPSGNFVYHQV